MRLLLAAWIGVFILGIAGINIYHHLELPVLNRYRVETHKQFDIHNPPFFYHNKTDIRLEDEVYNEYMYEDVLSALQNANSHDIIVFHLAGFGGQVDTEEVLVNAIHTTKAYTIMEVDAPVYSADTMIAISGNELHMMPLSLLHFHSSTLKNVDCSKITGSDRGVSNVEHCQAMKDALQLLEDKSMATVRILTPAEKLRIKNGYDVYLQADEVIRRQQGLRPIEDLGSPQIPVLTLVPSDFKGKFK